MWQQNMLNPYQYACYQGNLKYGGKDIEDKCRQDKVDASK